MHKEGDTCNLYLYGTIKIANIDERQLKLRFVGVFCVTVSLGILLQCKLVNMN